MIDKWRRCVERVQNKDENLDYYFHEKVKLCDDLNLKFDEVKEQVLVGLWDRQVCSIMFAKKHFDVNELLHDLHKFKTIEKKETSEFQK